MSHKEKNQRESPFKPPFLSTIQACSKVIKSSEYIGFLFNSLLAGKFCNHFGRLLIFFTINSFEKFFQEYHQSVKQIGPRTGQTF